MKNILSLLLCFLLIQSDVWALRGGPYGTGGVVGQYSGILVENAGADMGLFLLTANVSGPSSGQLVIFSQGPTNSSVFNCKLVGLSDSIKGGQLFGLFVGASGGSDNIAGQLTAKTILGSSRLGGTASSQAGAGPLKTYLIDGWQTPESTETLSL